jgi:hypothetical protein
VKATNISAEASSSDLRAVEPASGAKNGLKLPAPNMSAVGAPVTTNARRLKSVTDTMTTLIAFERRMPESTTTVRSTTAATATGTLHRAGTSKSPSR